MFGNMGFTEIALLLVLVLLLFGAKRLPEIGQSMGKGIREFKRSLSDTQDALMNPPKDDVSQVGGPQRMYDAEPRTPQTTGDPKRLSQ